MVYSHNRLLYSKINEWTTDICNNLGDFPKLKKKKKAETNKNAYNVWSYLNGIIK